MAFSYYHYIERNFIERQMKRRNIRFRKMNADDLKLLHQWFQIPHVLKWYARGEKYTFEMIQEK